MSAVEMHYTPNELAMMWGLSPETIRGLFENEPDVLIVGDVNGTRRKRRYRTFRIPESVVMVCIGNCLREVDENDD